MTENAPRTPGGRTEHRGAHVAIALALVVAVLCAYANSFPGAFFFDDDPAIAQNPSIRSLTSWHVLWPPVEAGIGGRPFANLSYALNYAFSGTHPAGYHATNLAIHIAAALLLFGIVRRSLLQPLVRERFAAIATPAAAAAAALWALHPLQVNVVDYMSQRTEGLMAALYLLTLYAFIRTVEWPSRGWTAVAVVACLLGMATKEDMATAPVMILLYDRTFVAGTFAAALRRRTRLYAGLFATWALLIGLMVTSKPWERGIGFGLGQGPFTYALTECRSVVRYLTLSFWPHPLVFDYGPSYVDSIVQALPSAVVLASVLAATVYALFRAPLLGFVGAWFFVILSPSSSVIPVVQQPCAENRVYLPLAAAMALLATSAHRLLGRRALNWLLPVALAFGGLTYLRNPVFASEAAVWWDSVIKRPDNARAANNLGNAFLKNGRFDDAMPYFDKAVALSPDYADAHNNRGVVLLHRGKPADALEAFKLAARYKARYADAQYNMGEAYLQLGRPTEAIPPLREALRLEPTNAKAHNNLGIALLDTGHVEESITEENAAVALSPGMPEAHYNLGNSLSRASRIPEALAAYDTALRLDPKFSRAHNNAGVLLMNMGRNADAAAHFEAALQIDPRYPEAQQNLALVRSRLGR